MTDAMDQIRAKEGEHFEHWLKRLALAVDDMLRETSGRQADRARHMQR